MAKLYKLTTQENKTYNDTLWGEGVTHKTLGKGRLCSSGWLHAYEHPLLAVFLNPVHGAFENPKLWEAEGEIEKEDSGLKVGTRKLTTIREIPLPAVSSVQKVAFAILCARVVCRDAKFLTWADKWLSGKDRTEESAYAMYSRGCRSITQGAGAANNAARAAHHLTGLHAANAVRSAAWFYEFRHPGSRLNLIKLAEEAMTYN